MKTTTTLLKRTGILVLFALSSIPALSQSTPSTATDTVCAATQDKVYGITGAVSTSTFDWFISDPSAGTIDNTVTTNNSEIEIDWGVNVGTYTIKVVETTENGCVGDTVTLDVVINPLPTVTASIDSVCEGYAPTMTLTLTGTAPWTVDYTDGTNNYSANIAASPATVALPNYTSSQTIDITGVTDGNTCAADVSGLPTGIPAYVYPKPSTGLIYHY